MTIHDPRLIKARASLVMQQPFFGALALYLELERDDSIETMGTDGAKLYYAQAFVDECTDAELKGVAVHEVLHCAYQHHTRRGDRDKELWNEACDYVVNRDAIAAGFTLPSDALIDKQYDGQGAEEIYARLASQQPRKDQKKDQAGKPGNSQGQGQPQASGKGQQGQGQPGDGQGQGNGQNAIPGPQNGAGQGQKGDPIPGSSQGNRQAGTQPASGGQPASSSGGRARWGQVLDAAPSHAPTALAEAASTWERRVRQALTIATAANAGQTPGTLVDLLNATNASKINWRDELRRFIDSRARCDHSWTSPNKRLLGHGFVLPGLVKDGLQKLGVVLDTSGSIDLALLDQFASELQWAVDEGAAEQVVVIQCDTRVTKVERFDRGDEIKLDAYGRGGTKFGPALAWFEENEPDVAVLIYFTDLDSDDFGREPECPLLWAAYGHESKLNRLMAKVPFGEVIPVTN